MNNQPHTQEQKSLEWFRARLGYITGSQVGTLMKSGRSKDKPFSDTALSYICQLAGERALNREIVNDDSLFSYYLEQTTAQSKAMRFGTEQEENARAMYIAITGRKVSEVGSCPHPRIGFFASSPDGMTTDNGEEGCIEIKCPTLATFTKYVADIKDNETLRAINPDYFFQCQAHMACKETNFCDFVVYSPFVENPLHVVRITRDDDAIAAIESRVIAAEELIQQKLAQISA